MSLSKLRCNSFSQRFSRLDYFLPHGTQFGFFLHLDRFRELALLPLPFGDVRRPSPALLSVVYLWGVQLSRSQPLISSESVFLKRAQQHISAEISESSSSTHLIHTIQAQVLLSAYMFRNKRFIEAQSYANGAATLALGSRLHKIRSVRPASPPLLGVSVLVEGYPGPPQNPVEEGERIRAFWAVACLQVGLYNTLCASSNPPILESSSADIDTPWPMEIVEYEAGMLPAAYQGQATITAFLTEDPLPSSAVCTLHAKAAVLLHRALRLGLRWSLSTSAFLIYLLLHDLTDGFQISSHKNWQVTSSHTPGLMIAYRSSGRRCRRRPLSTRILRPRGCSSLRTR